MKAATQINLRPIACIARKYARKSFQVGNFGMSEGYEIIRLCFADQVTIHFYPAMKGSSFHSIPCSESVASGTITIKKIAKDLVEAGYKVEFTTSLELRLTVIK